MTEAALAEYVAELRAKGIGVTVGPRAADVITPSPVVPVEAAPQEKRKPAKAKAELLPDAFVPPPAGKLWPVTFVVGVQTASEANEADWRNKSTRKGVIRSAVSRVLGKELAYLVPFSIAYHRGLPVRVHFVRLGGRRLDRLANLGTAMKAAEDTVCLILGADDGADNWKPTCDQEPGGPYGIRITLSLGS
jgi:hypothetical protein